MDRLCLLGVFFFQAEDGIRDATVTGVQTCALPISGMATCGLIFLATLSLEYLFFTDNFSSAYVVSHSNRDLPAFYKIAALWSGMEGSLLFWSFLLAVYVLTVLIAYRNKNGELMPYVGVVMAGVQLFFLTLNNFVESPF